MHTKTEAILQKHQLNYAIEWSLSGNPFFTTSGKLTDAAIAAIKNSKSHTAILDGGGTSDARFIALTGAEVIELEEQ